MDRSRLQSRLTHLASTLRACMLRPEMAIRFVEIKPAESTEALNSEWVILENDGKAAFNTRGCGMTVGRRGSNKKSLLGIIDPGFVLHPGERVRMCTGNPGTQAHGSAPEDGVKN